MRVSFRSAWVLFSLAASASAFGQDRYLIEPLKQAAPAELSAAIRAELSPEGYRVRDGKGKPFAEFWFRKAVPVSAKPSGPKGTILFPALAEGELLGALKFASEGRDFRDQSVSPDVYTMRYGLQPENGAHLGASPNRDFVLLLPKGKDVAVAKLARQGLEEASSEAAGSTHPAVFMLIAPPAPSGGKPSMFHDETKNTWGAVVPLPLGVKGENSPVPLDVQLVVVGVTMQ